MHFFSTTKRPVHTGGHHGDKNDDCDMSTVVKEDVEKGRNGWQHAAKMTRQAFLRVGTLAESANAANEIRDARLDAMEKRIGDLETRCHVLLNGLESEREDNARLTERVSALEKEHANFRNECETVVGGLEKQVLTMATETSQMKATTAKCARMEEIVKANEIALNAVAGSVDDAVAVANVAKDEAKRCVKMMERGFDVNEIRNDVNVLSAQMTRVESERKECEKFAQACRKAASKAETEARKADVERTKTQSFAEIVEQFNREVDRKMQALKVGLQACDDAEALIKDRAREAKAESDQNKDAMEMFAEKARRKLMESCSHVERVARTCANVADASTREMHEAMENEKETLRTLEEEMELRFRDECDRFERAAKHSKKEVEDVAETVKRQVVDECGQICDVVVAKFVQDRASELSETVVSAIKMKASDAAADARRCAEMCSDVSKVARDAEQQFQRKVDDGFRSVDIAIARAEAAQEDISTQKETILRAVDEALDALRQREASCSKRMHDESEERMRAFRRTIDELKQSVGNIDAADVVAFKKRCDGLEARVLECEKNGRVSFGTIEHVNRELERLTLDFNDVRVDVAERVKRDDEVCKELERLEKRVKEEIIAATERAQSFALMEIEPLRLENVEKIEGICEALFGLENGKMAGKDAQTIKAMTRTMFLESPRSSEMYLGGGGGGAAAVSMEMSSSSMMVPTTESEESASVFAKIRHLEALAKTFEKRSEVEKLANEIAARQTEHSQVLKSLHDGVQFAMRERPTREAVEHLVNDISERVLDLETDKEVNKTRLRQVSETAKEIIDRRCEALEATHRAQLRKLANQRISMTHASTAEDEVSSRSAFTKSNEDSENKLESILLHEYPKRTEMNAAIAGVENQIRRVEERTRLKLDLKADKKDVVALAERMQNVQS
tara:strand:- start:483 stop:3227 length:2745 start_codon:yes stop_codon:yes gene_type:complete